MPLRLAATDRLYWGMNPRAVALLLTSNLLIGCGSSTSEDDTSRNQGDDDQRADEGPDAGGRASAGGSQASEQSAADEPGMEGADDTVAAGSAGSSAEDIGDLCTRLCTAWEECPEAGGADCDSECRQSSVRAVEAACQAEMSALYDCMLLTGVCPEQVTMCSAEVDRFSDCVGANVGEPENAVTESSGSSGGVNVATGGEPMVDVPPPDPAEDFGGAQSTPQAIRDAAEIDQCSDFEVAEFSCGSTGVSFGGPLCTVECHDDDGIVWASLCRDGLCRCQYDGITYCQCEHEGSSNEGCNSCCPELADSDLRFQ